MELSITGIPEKVLISKMLQIAAFCNQETQKIIAELELLRFNRNGAFNGHEEWDYNSPKVIKDKGFDKPLIDSGNLRKELSTPKNWDLNPKFDGNTLTLTIPENEHFTDPKYDKLEHEQGAVQYTSRRGKKISLSGVPARKFKDFSQQDIQWIVTKLTQAIIRKFAN